MHDHARCLVDDDDVIVFVDDVQRNVLGLETRVLFDGRVERQHFMAVQFGFRLDLGTIDGELTGVDPRFQALAGVIAEQLRRRLVQTCTS